MSARFHGRGRHGSASADDVTRSREPGLSEWWAAIALIAFAAISVLALSSSADGTGGLRAAAASLDPTPEILAALEPAQKSLTEIEEALATLCREPVLLALELEPDCETGVMTIPDSLFDGFGSAELAPQHRESLEAAIRVYLARLRRLPSLWESLEAIEFRGHSDPRAFRSPYTTNMVGSQQRPLGVLLFLVEPGTLSSRDRTDIERLAVVSGASFSRPPASCPEKTRECYPLWRRVEIRPVLSETLRRGDWSRTLEDVRLSTQAIQQKLEARNR